MSIFDAPRFLRNVLLADAASCLASGVLPCRRSPWRSSPCCSGMGSKAAAPRAWPDAVAGLR